MVAPTPRRWLWCYWARLLSSASPPGTSPRDLEGIPSRYVWIHRRGLALRVESSQRTFFPRQAWLEVYTNQHPCSSFRMALAEVLGARLHKNLAAPGIGTDYLAFARCLTMEVISRSAFPAWGCETWRITRYQTLIIRKSAARIRVSTSAALRAPSRHDRITRE